MSILATKETVFEACREQCAERIRTGGPFQVLGGGTQYLGAAQERKSRTELRAPDKGWDYDPNALTLTVAAGVPLAQVSERLAAHNQRLGFEPPDLGPLLGRAGAGTIGGTVGSNASGPRRVAVGACRDFCLGVEFIDGRGQVIKNGGRVMKNVTGLDLVKLMVGSYGTLGLITEVSLKTQPIPEMAACLLIEGLSDADAIAAMSAALGTPFDVSGAAHLPVSMDGPPVTMIRLEGFESSVMYRARALQDRLTRFGASQIETSQDNVAAGWRYIRDVTPFARQEGDVWRVSVTPSVAAALVAKISPLGAIYDWGGNRVWLLTKPGTEVRAMMSSGHATLIRADDETRQRFGSFHPQAPALARLSEGLRRKFDPEQKFNPGMMG